MKVVVKPCIECKQHSAIHWNRSLCADCLNKLLKEKVEGENE